MVLYTYDGCSHHRDRGLSSIWNHVGLCYDKEGKDPFPWKRNGWQQGDMLSGKLGIPELLF